MVPEARTRPWAARLARPARAVVPSARPPHREEDPISGEPPQAPFAGPRHLRWPTCKKPARLPAALLTATLVLLVSAGCGAGEPDGGRPDGGRQVSPPEVAGTWVGSLRVEGAQPTPRLMLSLEQDGRRLSGHANWSVSDGGANDFDALEGEISPSGGLRLDREREVEDGFDRVYLQGDVKRSGAISGSLGTEEDGEGGELPFELERLDAADPEELSAAVVQALHTENFRLLYDHASLALRAARGGEYAEFAEEVDAGYTDELVPSGTFDVSGTEFSMSGVGREEYNVYGTDPAGDSRVFKVLTTPAREGGPYTYCEVSVEDEGEERYVIEPNC